MAAYSRWSLVLCARLGSNIGPGLEDIGARMQALGVDLAMFLDADTITLSYIRLSPELRSQGTGTEAMKLLCQYADGQGLKIVLAPNSERLANWYRRLGFAPAHDGDQYPATVTRMGITTPRPSGDYFIRYPNGRRP